MIVTAAADQGLVDIHDSRPLVLKPETGSISRMDTAGYQGAQAVEIAGDGAISTDYFSWHPVSRAVVNVKNQGLELIEAIKSL
ncbi:SOS response-associated protein YedK [Klebsiella pneumoniae]